MICLLIRSTNSHAMCTLCVLGYANENQREKENQNRISERFSLIKIWRPRCLCTYKCLFLLISLRCHAFQGLRQVDVLRRATPSTFLMKRKVGVHNIWVVNNNQSQTSNLSFICLMRYYWAPCVSLLQYLCLICILRVKYVYDYNEFLYFNFSVFNHWTLLLSRLHIWRLRTCVSYSRMSPPNVFQPWPEDKEGRSTDWDWSWHTIKLRVT